MHKCFIVERKTRRALELGIFLRLLYTPIIGSDAIAVYSLLDDFHFMHGSQRSFTEFRDLGKHMALENEDAVFPHLRKLEAIGLVRTFEAADGYRFIITLNDPLHPEYWRKNAFLHRMLVAKIGDVAFEKIEASFRDRQLAKDDYRETTTKFQDIFGLSVTTKPSNHSSTLTVPLNAPSSRVEAIRTLSCAQLVHFLTNDVVSPSQLAVLQKLQNDGFAGESINVMVDYVVEMNNRLVVAHLEAIATDLRTKDIVGPEAIASELAQARKARKQSRNDDYSAIESPMETATTIVDESSWEELFKSLGGEL